MDLVKNDEQAFFEGQFLISTSVKIELFKSLATLCLDYKLKGNLLKKDELQILVKNLKNSSV